MKILFLILYILTFQLANNDIYSIGCKDINGRTINLNEFKDRKIIIALIEGSNPKTEFLVFLDSIQKVKSDYKIIIIPSEEFGGPSDIPSLLKIKEKFGESLTMTSPMNVTKSSGNLQHPLLKWLTDVNLNQHYNKDAEGSTQLFFIAPGAIIYSVISPQAPIEVINRLLANQVNSQQ